MMHGQNKQLSKLIEKKIRIFRDVQKKIRLESINLCVKFRSIQTKSLQYSIFKQYSGSKRYTLDFIDPSAQISLITCSYNH